MAYDETASNFKEILGKKIEEAILSHPEITRWVDLDSVRGMTLEYDYSRVSYMLNENKKIKYASKG